MPPDYAPNGTNPGVARDVQMKMVEQKGRTGRRSTGRNPVATTRTPATLPATLMAEVEAWATAKELAGKVIDDLADGAASVGDRASRKRRLLKGPEEFREARVDRPKARK